MGTAEAPALAARWRAWRSAEIEEPINRYFIHPLSWILTQWFARWGIHPNHVSLMGLGCGIGAAIAYGFGREGWTCMVGLLCMLLWHILDGADGQLARLTGRASELGKLFDGLCDHGTFVALYTALAASLVPQMGPWAFLLAAGAGLSHFVQASAYERQRQLYEGIVLGKPVLTPAWEQVPAVLRGLYRVYWAVQKQLSGERYLFVLLRDGMVWYVRRLYRLLLRPVVYAWSVLSSNYRTAALFVLCCAGMPAAFFWWELIGLNGLMVLLGVWTYRRQRQLSAVVWSLRYGQPR